MQLASIVTLSCFLLAVALAHDTSGRPGRGAFKGFTVVNPQIMAEINEIDAREYDKNDIIPEAGVSKECLVKMDNIAWQVQQNGFMSLCPKQQFGALLVNFQDKTGSVKDSLGRSCGRILQTNHAPKNNYDISEHSEIDGIRRWGYTHGIGQRNNASFWEPIAIFTPGASCPMDASAIRWGALGWHIASLTIEDLISLNFTQIAVEPEYILRRSGTITASRPAGAIRYVNREANIGRFGYRNIIANPCPVGCHRVGPDCVDINPFVLTPDKLIPDVNYYVAPGNFSLVF